MEMETSRWGRADRDRSEPRRDRPERLVVSTSGADSPATASVYAGATGRSVVQRDHAVVCVLLGFAHHGDIATLYG